jgi:hypothetical protein
LRTVRWLHLMASPDPETPAPDAVLGSVGGASSETLDQHAAGLGDAASIRIESAEGITMYSGFDSDDESDRARGWVDARLQAMRAGPTAETPSAGDGDPA